ncbi:hypothetical protein SUGI_1481540 [Cryptomeria japonica]|uniref:Secreted protein n=1 Tax=Cryptomeria japonica TaxID=3369 RepID=A0AAD3NU10_CRYJA|nr:hypothetical protein SUGI_1481540 [Cryptomeria japonica]
MGRLLRVVLVLVRWAWALAPTCDWFRGLFSGFETGVDRSISAEVASWLAGDRHAFGVGSMAASEHARVIDNW